MKIKNKLYVTLLFLLATFLNLLVLSPLGLVRSAARYFLHGWGDYRPSHLLYITFLILFAVYYEGDFMVEKNGRTEKLFLLFVFVSMILSKTAYGPEINVLIITLSVFCLSQKAIWNFVLLGAAELCYALPTLYRMYRYGSFDQILLSEKREIISNAHLLGNSGVTNRQNPYCGLPVQILQETGWVPLLLITTAFLLLIVFTFKTAKQAPDKQRGNICKIIGIQIGMEVTYALSEIIHPLPVALLPYLEYPSAMKFTYLLEVIIILQVHLQNRITIRKQHGNKFMGE